MKFIHTADVHLDSSSTRLKRLAGQKELSIAECQNNAFRALVDLAIKEKVDFVLIAGDLFDSNWKDFSVGLLFIQAIKRLRCPIYYIRGNHDSENRLLKKLPYPAHLHVFESKQPQTYIDDNLKVAIHGQSYSHYHMREDLSKNYPEAKRGYFNIGLLHTSGEISNGEKPYAPYSLHSIESKKYDYWAMGHIHTAQVISKKPYRVYSGVLQGRHIKESGAKGCYLVEVLDEKVTSLSFRVLSSHFWEELFVDISKVHTEDDFKKAIISTFQKKVNEEKNIKAYILRITCIGCFQLDKKISCFEEYWKSSIYLWLSELVDQKIYIEKLVDQTTSIQSNELMNNPIFKTLADKLSMTEQKDWINKTLEEEKEQIYKKLPKDILDLIEKNSEESSSSEVNQYLSQKLQEILNENSSD